MAGSPPRVSRREPRLDVLDRCRSPRRSAGRCPRRAALLRSVFEQARDAEVGDRLDTIVQLLEKDQLLKAGNSQTGAIDKLQQIIGVALAPATRMNIDSIITDSVVDSAVYQAAINEKQPVVFVGPYEHHSNEISWRSALAETVEVQLDAAGHIDLGHLEELLQDPAYLGRLRIGSFSAASNVTGIRTDVRAVTTLLHRYDTIACFDYAACAPYRSDCGHR